jgi:zinc transporter 9
MALDFGEDWKGAFDEDAQGAPMTTSTRAVTIALLVDFLIGGAKVVAFLLTGSTAIMAEALHSAADITNQSLLVVGINRSKRAPDSQYPYGFGRSRYIWSLLSATGVLFVGSGVSVVRGAEQLWAPEALSHMHAGLIVLLVSLAAEGVSLMVGLSAVKASARSAGGSIWRYIQIGPDPMGVAVVLEDAAAVIGVLVALLGLGLTELTGNPAWDGAASILIGFLLGLSAIFLINRNRRFLLGPTPPSESVSRMVAVLKRSPVVARIKDVKVSQLGVDSVRFKAEVTFDGREIARRLLDRSSIDATWTTLESAEDLERLLIDFGGQLTDAIGDEIDRLEEELAAAAPEAQHVDIEPD